MVGSEPLRSDHGTGLGGVAAPCLDAVEPDPTLVVCFMADLRRPPLGGVPKLSVMVGPMTRRSFKRCLLMEKRWSKDFSQVSGFDATAVSPARSRFSVSTA